MPDEELVAAVAQPRRGPGVQVAGRGATREALDEEAQPLERIAELAQHLIVQ